MFKQKFKNKKVLITGHTGFKGSWLTTWMLKLQAKVCGISLKPARLSNFFLLDLENKIENHYLDIRNYEEFKKVVINFKPDYIFHLAAQAIVKTSFDNPRLTWETNVMGTVNLLESLKKLKKNCNVVLITSDKCYYNKEWIWGYKENDELGGKDPYSASKASAEHVIHSYVNSFYLNKSNKIRIASARAGNVIGGGDWSENRIIPDCIKSWISEKKVIIKNPKSTRPWQHVLEPLGGYINLALSLSKDTKLHGESFNFGPPMTQDKTVLDIVSELSTYFEKSKWKIQNKAKKNIIESNLLKLNCEKAFHKLNWNSSLDFSDIIFFTSDWYQSYLRKKNLIKVTNDQIESFYAKAISKGNKWIK